MMRRCVTDFLVIVLLLVIVPWFNWEKIKHDYEEAIESMLSS